MISPQRSRRLTIVLRIRQAALCIEGGEIVTALELLDEARALIEEQLGEEEHGNNQDGPPGPH